MSSASDWCSLQFGQDVTMTTARRSGELGPAVTSEDLLDEDNSCGSPELKAPEKFADEPMT